MECESATLRGRTIGTCQSCNFIQNSLYEKSVNNCEMLLKLCYLAFHADITNFLWHFPMCIKQRGVKCQIRIEKNIYQNTHLEVQ